VQVARSAYFRDFREREIFRQLDAIRDGAFEIKEAKTTRIALPHLDERDAKIAVTVAMLGGRAGRNGRAHLFVLRVDYRDAERDADAGKQERRQEYAPGGEFHFVMPQAEGDYLRGWVNSL
jgi:hypothetical protein